MNDFTRTEVSEFKRLFSKFCRVEIGKGKCGEDECEFCHVNHGYTEIFDTLERNCFDEDDDE